MTGDQHLEAPGPRAHLMRTADPGADKHDLLVQARNGLAVTYARYWLALRRASRDDGPGGAAARAEADRHLARAGALRAQALQVDPGTDAAMGHSPSQPGGCPATAQLDGGTSSATRVRHRVVTTALRSASARMDAP
jgi:hypothetical protein